jgi:acetyl-CoA decarbonylase/synthase complex subunit beta
MSESLDYDALAGELASGESRSLRHQTINETLIDSRALRQLPASELAVRLAADPLACMAAMELTAAASHLAHATPSEAEFLRPFADNRELLRRMVYIAAELPEGSALDLPGAKVIQRTCAWDGLLFLSSILRWASRFGNWKGGLRDLRRILYGYPFAAAVISEPETAEDGVIFSALAGLGVEMVDYDRHVAMHHLNAWLSERLGLRPTLAKAKQQRLDFRQAGGTQNSLYVVRAMGGVDGVDVRGSTGDDLALIIDISDREVSVAATAYLERLFATVINEQTPLSAELTEGSLRIRWYDTRLTPEDLGQIIYDALRKQFILSVISVNIIFDPLRIGSLRPSVLSYREDRTIQLKKRTEEGSPFVVCTSCKRYAPNAFCIASVDRPPCCGRPYDELATLAQLTRDMEQLAVDRGICQDRARGTYLGAEKAARVYSLGSVARVNLHSLRENPHPTTAIPECIAYFLEELDLLCILSKDYSGRSPDGKTFDSLLARIAGRQVPGFAGISEAYILSGRFLAPDGGLSRVGWMNSTLKARLKVNAEHIATEKDCINLAGLKDFLAAWRH